MSSGKQKLDHGNVHTVVGRRFSDGGEWASRFGITNIAVFRCIVIAVVVVGAAFDTTQWE
jgi:hypothetical protein